MAQLLDTLGPTERDAVQAVYVDRLPFAAAAAHLSIDQAALGAALAAAFKTVARWVDTHDGEGASMGTARSHPNTHRDSSPAHDAGCHGVASAANGERAAS